MVRSAFRIFALSFAVTTVRAVLESRRINGRTLLEALLSLWLNVSICALLFGVELNYWMNEVTANGAGGQGKAWDFGVQGGEGGEEVVLITGGEAGIGRQLVERLVARVGRGVKLVVLDRDPAGAQAGENVIYFQCDVSDRQQVMDVAKAIVERVGHPTVLVNNAGVVRARSVLDSSEGDINSTFDINCKAHYWTVQAFAPHMVAQNKGHIITIASSTAYCTAPLGVSYAASKAAALSFHEGLSAELTHLHHANNVQTSVVCPGHVKTAMFEGFNAGKLPRWFAPSLEPSSVAQAIVKTIVEGKSKHLILPFYSRTLPLLRALPAWMYRAAIHVAKDSLKEVARRQEETRVAQEQREELKSVQA